MTLLSYIFKRERIEKGMSIILRLPGLFILDYYCHSSDIILDSTDENNQDMTTILTSFMPFQAILFLLLPLQHLVTLYMHIFSAALLGYAALYSQRYVSLEHSKDSLEANPLLTLSSKFNMMEPNFDQIQHHFEAICLHIIIATIISFLLNMECNTKRAVLAVYTVPVAARLVGFPIEYLTTLHKCASIVTLLSVVFYCLTSLPAMLLYLRQIYRTVAQSDYIRGPLDLQHILCEKFYIMPQFLVFWCLLLGLQLYNYSHPQVPRAGSTVLFPAEHSEWYLVLLYAMSEICSSPFSLIASCTAVMYISWAVLRLTIFLAKGAVVDHGLARAGTGEGITMALLALQTGLVDLPMPQRLGAMSVILFIVLGSLVQSMHELVEPMLLSLCASHIHSFLRHARVLALCIFLLFFPLYMTIFLCHLFEVDFWTLVVVSTCTLTSVQVFGALTVYTLFMYDALYKDSNWEVLDDVVYVARAVTRVLEFLVAVLVVGAGVRESMMLSSEGRPWSWLNGSVLVIHFYYNVYQRLQSGWKSFLLRREAARKIHSLPCATETQLRSRAHDVCAICYVEMKTACVTPCTHLFHATCLKKWLYVQDRCPLCSAQIVFSKVPDAEQTPEAQPVPNPSTSSVPSSANNSTQTDHSIKIPQTSSNNNDLMKIDQSSEIPTVTLDGNIKSMCDSYLENSVTSSDSPDTYVLFHNSSVSLNSLSDISTTSIDDSFKLSPCSSDEEYYNCLSEFDSSSKDTPRSSENPDVYNSHSYINRSTELQCFSEKSPMSSKEQYSENSCTSSYQPNDNSSTKVECSSENSPSNSELAILTTVECSSKNSLALSDLTRHVLCNSTLVKSAGHGDKIIKS